MVFELSYPLVVHSTLLQYVYADDTALVCCGLTFDDVNKMLPHYA